MFRKIATWVRGIWLRTRDNKAIIMYITSNNPIPFVTFAKNLCLQQQYHMQVTTMQLLCKIIVIPTQIHLEPPLGIFKV